MNSNKNRKLSFDRRKKIIHKQTNTVAIDAVYAWSRLLHTSLAPWVCRRNEKKVFSHLTKVFSIFFLRFSFLFVFAFFYTIRRLHIVQAFVSLCFECSCFACIPFNSNHFLFFFHFWNFVRNIWKWWNRGKQRKKYCSTPKIKINTA